MHLPLSTSRIAESPASGIPGEKAHPPGERGPWCQARPPSFPSQVSDHKAGGGQPCLTLQQRLPAISPAGRQDRVTRASSQTCTYRLTSEPPCARARWPCRNPISAPAHRACQAQHGGHHSWEFPGPAPCQESLLSLLPDDVPSPAQHRHWACPFQVCPPLSAPSPRRLGLGH